jgi:hypothetical protein
MKIALKTKYLMLRIVGKYAGIIIRNILRIFFYFWGRVEVILEN